MLGAIKFTSKISTNRDKICYGKVLKKHYKHRIIFIYLSRLKFMQTGLTYTHLHFITIIITITTNSKKKIKKKNRRIFCYNTSRSNRGEKRAKYLACSMSHRHIIEFDAVNKVYKRKLCTTPFYPLPLAFCISLTLNFSQAHTHSHCNVAQHIFSLYCHVKIEFIWD